MPALSAAAAALVVRAAMVEMEVLREAPTADQAVVGVVVAVRAEQLRRTTARTAAITMRVRVVALVTPAAAQAQEATAGVGAVATVAVATEMEIPLLVTREQMRAQVQIGMLLMVPVAVEVGVDTQEGLGHILVAQQATALCMEAEVGA
jgi:hypothetical protein